MASMKMKNERPLNASHVVCDLRVGEIGCEYGGRAGVWLCRGKEPRSAFGFDEKSLGFRSTLLCCWGRGWGAMLLLIPRVTCHSF